MSKIGVVLPVYNGEKYIRSAVESILNQTYKDFTLYVIEDGSTDGTMNVLDQITDDRLKVIQNEGNKGLIYSLNVGLELVKNCKYIARMDADDISLPNRFEVQYNFLEKNPDIGLLGAAMLQFGNSKKDSKKIFRPQASNKIASTFMFYNPISHPTVMIRTEKLDSGFSYDFPKYEDYHLWIKNFKNIGVYNLNDIVLKYRRHGNNVTSTYYGEVLKDHDYIQKLIRLFADEVGVELTDEEINIISIISSKVRYEINSELDLNDLYNTQKAIVLKLNDFFEKDFFEYLFQERMFLYFLNYKKYKQALITVSRLKFKHKTKLLSTIIFGKKD